MLNQRIRFKVVKYQPAEEGVVIDKILISNECASDDYAITAYVVAKDDDKIEIVLPSKIEGIVR
jgi:hypothetical protein